MSAFSITLSLTSNVFSEWFGPFLGKEEKWKSKKLISFIIMQLSHCKTQFIAENSPSFLLCHFKCPMLNRKCYKNVCPHSKRFKWLTIKWKTVKHVTLARVPWNIYSPTVVFFGLFCCFIGLYSIQLCLAASMHMSQMPAMGLLAEIKQQETAHRHRTYVLWAGSKLEGPVTVYTEGQHATALPRNKLQKSLKAGWAWSFAVIPCTSAATLGRTMGRVYSLKTLSCEFKYSCCSLVLDNSKHRGDYKLNLKELLHLKRILSIHRIACCLLFLYLCRKFFPLSLVRQWIMIFPRKEISKCNTLRNNIWNMTFPKQNLFQLLLQNSTVVQRVKEKEKQTNKQTVTTARTIMYKNKKNNKIWNIKESTKFS